MATRPVTDDLATQRARVLLGVDAAADDDALRAAYHRLLMRTHPDVSGAGDATERTVELTRAYRLLLARAEATSSPSSPTSPTSPPDPAAGAAPPAAPRRERVPPRAFAEPVTVELLDDQTIAVGAPPGETLLVLVDAANRLGDISYLDAAAGLLEVVVEFIEAPTSSVLLSLQGRATGVTEVFCTVEPLSGGQAPPSDAVTRLLLQTLHEVVDAPAG